MARVLSRAGLKIGLEETSGTYKKPTGVLKVESVISPNVEMDSVEIPNFGFYGGAKDVVTIADWGRGSIELTSSLYTDIAFYESLFAICNLKKSEILDTDGKTPKAYEFTPDTHNTKTASLDLILPDRTFKFKGAKSGFRIAGKVGEKINTTFKIEAAYEDRVIENNTITDVKAGEALLIRRLGGMTLKEQNINLSEFGFDMGNVINYEKFTNVGEFHMSDYEPTLELTMRLEMGADDGFDEFKNGGIASFSAIFRDSKNKEVFRLEIPRCKLKEQPTFEDSEGIYVIKRKFIALSDKGDDNFKLTYFKG